MKNLITIVTTTVAACLMFQLFSAASPTLAMRPATLAPAVVATVDLERVFNECTWRTGAEMELDRRSQEFQKKAEQMREDAELLKQDLDLLLPGTDQYKKAERKYLQSAVEYRAFVEFSNAKLESLRATSRTEIFGKIQESAAAFARANNISFIITNDSVIDLQEGTDRQVIQQLLLRRVVYADPDFDITEDLITWINEQ